MNKEQEVVLKRITDKAEGEFIKYAEERVLFLEKEIKKRSEELDNLLVKLDKVKLCNHKNYERVCDFIYTIYQCECGMQWED